VRVALQLSHGDGAIEDAREDVEHVPAGELVNRRHDQEGAVARRAKTIDKTTISKGRHQNNSKRSVHKDEDGTSEEDGEKTHEDAEANNAADKDPDGEVGLNVGGDNPVERRETHDNDGHDGAEDEAHEEDTNLEDEHHEDAAEDASAGTDAHVNPVSETGLRLQDLVGDKIEEDEALSEEEVSKETPNPQHLERPSSPYSNEENGLQEAVTGKAPDQANEDGGSKDTNLDPVHGGSYRGR